MATAEQGKRNIPWFWIGAVAVLAALMVAWFLLPVSEWLQAFNQWIAGLGIWGVIIFGLVYAVGTVLLAPGAALSITAGLAYSGWAFPLVIVAATIGASLAFLVGRYLAQHKVQQMSRERPKFGVVERAVSEEGWRIVMLLRLSPVVPFNLQNYFFGVTEIPFWHYAAATFFGIMPGAALYVYLGAIGSAAGAGGQGSALKWVFIGIGLIATIIVVVLVTRKAKAKLEAYGVEPETAQS